MNSTKKCSETHYINYNTALTNHPYTTAQVIYVRDVLVIKWKKIQFKIKTYLDITNNQSQYVKENKLQQPINLYT